MTTFLKNRVGAAPATEVYEPSETRIIEADVDLYQRVVLRLANPGEAVPAEDVLGSLDEDDEA